MASRRELRGIETMVASSGGGEERGGRNASEREKTKLRERKRRAITTKIFNGLRKHGGYQLPPRADINDVLGELAREAGWVVEPDGTTYPSHHREPSNPGRVVHLLLQCPACGYSVPARTASLRRTPPAVSTAETALPPPLHATCPWSSSSSSSPPAMPFLLGSNLAGSQAETVASPSLPISAGNSAAAFTWNGGGCKLCGVGGGGKAGSRRRGEGGERDEDDDADAAGEGIQSQHSNWVLLSGGCLMDGDIGELPQSAF